MLTHWASVSAMAEPHGSWKPNSTLFAGAKDSSTVGARTARCQLARRRKSSIGCQSAASFQASVPPTDE